MNGLACPCACVLVPAGKGQARPLGETADDVDHRRKSRLPLSHRSTRLVGECQVLLDTVIRRLRRVLPAEAIAHAHSTLSLADVYAVLGYYLRHKEEVDAYLRRRRRRNHLQKEIEAKQPQQGLRERLRTGAEYGGREASLASSVTSRSTVTSSAGLPP